MISVSHFTRQILFICILVVFVIPISTSVTLAQSPERALEKVEEYFRSQYGRDYVVLQWTYVVETWTDTSLGCPQPGIVYDEETIRGYNFSLEIDDDNTYELHSTLDGSSVVLCTPIDRALLIDFRTYQNGIYLIDYPDTWQIIENDNLSEVIISPRGEDDCEEVGLKILQRPVFGDATSMLNDAIREAGLVQNIGLQTPVGDSETALTMLYQAACGSIIRQYRVSAFPDQTTGFGIVILQWSPIPEFTEWSELYLDLVRSFRLLNGETVEENVASDIETDRLLAGYPIAHVFVQDIFIGEYSDLPGYSITSSADRLRRGLKFSSDGQYLAYIEPDFINGGERLEVGTIDAPRMTISPEIVTEFPATWSPNTTTLAFLTATDDEIDEDGTRLLEIHTATLEDRDNQPVIGQIPFVDDCEEQTTSYVSQKLYWQETGTNGNMFIFEWLPDDRFLFTMHCDGTGLAIWSPSDNSVETLGEDLRRPALTHDRTQLAAMDQNRGVQTINLQTGTLTPLTLDFPADQIAWSSDGRKLYYTNLFPTDDSLAINDPSLETVATDVLGTFPYESRQNTVSILEFNLATGATTTVWQGQAFAVGRMIAAPNNAGVLFSLIPSDREYALAFIEQSDSTTLRFLRPETQLFWLYPAASEAQLIAVASQPVISNAIPPSDE